MGYIYDGTKLLSLNDIDGNRPEIYICTSNRSAGKTTWFNRYVVRRYLRGKATTAGTFTIDAGKTGFTLDIASLSAPHYIKFCVKGVGANLTATLTPK